VAGRGQELRRRDTRSRNLARGSGTGFLLVSVIFMDEPDTEVSPLGAKGVGEIGVVGTAAAVVNALHHATGKRVRSLPVTLDKLLA
jgi:hypothetical protein